MKMKNLWILALVAWLLAPGAAWSKNEALNGVVSVRPFIARLTDDSERCGLVVDAMRSAVEKPLTDNGIELSPTAQVYFFVNVTTIFLEPQKYCMSSVSIDVYTRQYVDLSVTGKSVPATITLWEAGIVFGGAQASHANEVIDVLNARASDFALDWLAAQQ